jgi:hypothetical protein
MPLSEALKAIRISSLCAGILCGAACRSRSQPSQETAAVSVVADNKAAPSSVAPGQLRPGPIRHATLTPTQIARIEAIQKTFAEFDPSPLDKWIDDFKRDQHPDREIAIYEAMAQAYTGYCSHHTLTREAREEVYGLILARSGAPDDEVMRGARLQHLRREDAIEVLRGYSAPPQPILVEKP